VYAACCTTRLQMAFLVRPELRTAFSLVLNKVYEAYHLDCLANQDLEHWHLPCMSPSLVRFEICRRHAGTSETVYSTELGIYGGRTVKVANAFTLFSPSLTGDEIGDVFSPKRSLPSFRRCSNNEASNSLLTFSPRRSLIVKRTDHVDSLDHK
jgi:hypothetical protein